MPYLPHSLFKELPRTQELWRYLDFPKFAALIQNQALYFPALTQFADDPWEGYPSKMNFHPERDLVVTKKQATEAGEIVGEIQLIKAKEFFGEQFYKINKMQKESYDNLRNTFFVNWWHMNNTESDSQWKIYGNAQSSLAIVTSFERICGSIEDLCDIYGSEVFYYEPNAITPEGNVFWSVIYKRRAFCHEREFRLIHWDINVLYELQKTLGKHVRVNLEKLVSRVVISPTAPNWFVDVVKNFLKKCNLSSIPVLKSDLLESFIL